MGRASRQKRARRQERAERRDLDAVAGTIKLFSEWIGDQQRRLKETTALWWTGTPVPVHLSQWPTNSLGDRLFSDPLFRRVLDVPPLDRATLPGAAMIASDPAQWEVAAWVLVRAAVLDGLSIEDETVAALVEMLFPVVQAELAAAEARHDGLSPGAIAPRGFDGDGPVFVIGCCALVQATWTVIGEDPLAEILDLLSPLLDGVLPGRGTVVAEALVRAFCDHYACERQGDSEVLARLGGETSGDALQDLVLAGVVPPEDALGVGLDLVARLAQLCMSDAVSVFDRPIAAAG